MKVIFLFLLTILAASPLVLGQSSATETFLYHGKEYRDAMITKYGATQVSIRSKDGVEVLAPRDLPRRLKAANDAWLAAQARSAQQNKANQDAAAELAAAGIETFGAVVLSHYQGGLLVMRSSGQEIFLSAHPGTADIADQEQIRVKAQKRGLQKVDGASLREYAVLQVLGPNE